MPGSFRAGRALLGCLAVVALVACSSSGSSTPTTTQPVAPASTDSAPTESAPPDSAPPDSAPPDSAPDTESTSIAAMLAEMPATTTSPGEAIFLTYADFDLATELAGIGRPARDAEDRLVGHWGAIITGLNETDDNDEPTVTAALVPQMIVSSFYEGQEILADVGWSPADIGAYLAEETGPSTFLVMSGPDADDLASVLGEPVSGVWRIGDGDDFTAHISDRTPARRLGEPLNEAVARGLLAITPDTPAMTAWLASSGPVLADDAGLLAVAAALDDSDVYSAELAVPAADAATDGEVHNPFDAIGVGVGIDGDGPYAVFVYHYADASQAEPMAKALEEIVREGTSFFTQRPLSEHFAFESAVTSGDVVTMRLRFAPDQKVRFVWSFIPAQDVLATRGAPPD